MTSISSGDESKVIKRFSFDSTGGSDDLREELIDLREELVDLGGGGKSKL